MDIENPKHAQFLGKSEKGVYLATLHGSYQLRVWTLAESNGGILWVLKYCIDLEPWKMVWLHDLDIFDKTWAIADNDDAHYYNYYHDDDDDDDDD
jgi:hypothetical protein